MAFALSSGIRCYSAGPSPRPRFLRLVPCRSVPGDGNVGAALAVPRSRAVRCARGTSVLRSWISGSSTPTLTMRDPSIRRSSTTASVDTLDALGTPALQRRYLLAHTALRQLLGQALGLPPRDVRIVREACPRCGTAGGRPVLGEPTRPLHFSMSSSKHLVLLGLASAAVGVDVEAVPSLRTVSEASELLHPAEREELLAMAPEDRRATFTRLWSRKEAYLKGIGVGLAHGLVDEYLGTRPQAGTPRAGRCSTLPYHPVLPRRPRSRPGRTSTPRRTAPDVERHDDRIRGRGLVVTDNDPGLFEPGALVQPSGPFVVAAYVEAQVAVTQRTSRPR